MSLLSRKIAAEVDAQAGPGKVTAADGPYHLSLNLTAASPVGVAFDALEFADEDAAGRSAEALRAWGGRLASRLTYLMEPLVVIEVDDQAGEAELRSKSPTVRDGVQSYYEIRLHRAGRLGLRRVAFSTSDRRRQPVSCQLTREALDRLANDLVATVA
jgi:hypothetical protein